MSQFQVAQTLRTEQAFIIKGILLEGQLSKGMYVHVPLNNSLQVNGCITEIRKDKDHYDIVVGCSDQDEIELWEMLNLNGDVICIQ
ncbi:hypothetical protein PM3016_679 [Paenibacillus mucilaginosus 3016]|uniref:Uncharacterized protein n=2 Tax=Paenibacillus mucilaginosus TaxID=61624 RepID=H6NTP5_9BACL|nr:hypothetical protein PM3016_679 [Paenibacillus mucilaginosus 3016]AGN70561.1 hypothetical protein B2K_38420 [Paenibacillus mucilaginosus K02]WFA16526.1 hypothetical protein ERY13_03690 [Paenibacillus mucilaginosus]